MLRINEHSTTVWLVLLLIHRERWSGFSNWFSEWETWKCPSMTTILFLRGTKASSLTSSSVCSNPLPMSFSIFSVPFKEEPTSVRKPFFTATLNYPQYSTVSMALPSLSHKWILPLRIQLCNIFSWFTKETGLKRRFPVVIINRHQFESILIIIQNNREGI